VRRLVQIALHGPERDRARCAPTDVADDLLTFLGWELERPAPRAERAR
jgi:hypothetical protein